MNKKITWEEACLILGVLPTTPASDIRSQYIYKAQLLHPDKTINSPPNVREKAEEELKRVNTAYDFLKDPENRPNNSPPKLHVTLNHIRFNVDLGQKKSTTFKVNNSGGPYTSFWMDDSPASWLKVIEAKSVTDTPLPIEVTIEAAGTDVSNGHTECYLPIRIENELTKTKDETRIRIELKIKSSPVSSSAQTFKIPTISKMQKWTMALILVVAFSIFGLGISLFVDNYLPLWILFGFSFVYSIEKWFNNVARKYKATKIIYRVFLNLSILFLLVLLVWSGVQLFSHQYFKSSIIGSSIFIAEIIFFIWICRIVAKHNSQWPSMKLTIFSLVVLFLIFAFADVSPFMELKDGFFSIFTKE